MGAVINSDQLLTMKRDYTTAYRDGLAGKTRNTAEPLVQRIPMGTKTIDIPMVEDISGLREWIGPREFDQLKARGYSMSAKKFEKSIEVDKEDVEDDLYGIYTGAFKALGRKVSQWMDHQVWKLINAGETELGYDKKPLFATDHPEGDGVASNLLGSGGPGWILADLGQDVKPIIWGDRTKPEFTAHEDPKDPSVFNNDKFRYGVRVRGVAKPGLWQLMLKSKATLDTTNFDSAFTTMMERLNHAGESLEISPTHLFVPPSLRAAARAVVLTEKLAGGADNPNYKAVEVVVVHRLKNVA